MSVLCARCADGVASESMPCPRCQVSPLLDGRFALLEMIGHSSERTSWRARRIADGSVVAVKRLLFRGLGSLKTEELFNREARVLAQLSHPCVPRFLESFVLTDGTRS